MDTHKQLVYADNCRHVLHRTLAEHPEALDRPIDTMSRFSTIGKLVAHCIGAEERWIELRLVGRPLETRYEAWAAETVDGLFADWDQIRTRTRAFVDSQSAEALQTMVDFSLPEPGYEDELTVAQILFHVFNHQTYHFGQISMALQQMNIDPPNFDYTFHHRESLSD